MTVETHHLNLFPSQLLPNNREMNIHTTDTSFINMYNYSSLLPLSGTTTTVSDNLIPTLPPPYNPFINDNLLQKISTMKSESTLTYNNNNTNNNVVSFPRKRSRDSINNYPYVSNKNLSENINHQDSDIDNIISQHMEKVRVEMEEKRKRQTRMLMEAMMKRLKAKEEEMEKIEIMNMMLEERAKSLSMENQIWREIAQSKEATANALRNNLEQVLTQIANNGGEDTAVVPEDDAESCCGSNEDFGWRTVAEDAQDKDNGEGTTSGGSGRVMVMNEGCSEKKRLCRNCGKRESCVLILPCRHLCLCTMCGAMVNTCPICKSFKNASYHVNLS